jgi:hypothetical protein
MKLNLTLKSIPRSPNGDPHFDRLEYTPLGSTVPGVGILDVFTSAEVVELVNRALYQLEYQRLSHAKRQREHTDLLRPVKLAAKRVLNLPYSKLTTEQVSTLLQMLKENPRLGEENDDTL